MNHFERRLRRLEAAAGLTDDGPTCFVRVVVQPGETVDEVIEREGVPDGAFCIARIIVDPGEKTAG